MLYLKEINYEDIEKEFRFVREMPVDENGLTNPWNDISRTDFENKALPEMISFSKGENLPEGYVPETFLFLWKNNDIGTGEDNSLVKYQNEDISQKILCGIKEKILMVS